MCAQGIPCSLSEVTDAIPNVECLQNINRLQNMGYCVTLNWTFASDLIGLVLTDELT